MDSKNISKNIKYEPVKKSVDDLTLENIRFDRKEITGSDFASHELALIEITYLMSYKENINKKRKDRKTTRFVHPWNVARILA
ncbi:MAG: hypothetical protein QGH40_11420, partial [bacterium]|nr:hypothetical protein [bacterium]